MYKGASSLHCQKERWENLRCLRCTRTLEIAPVSPQLWRDRQPETGATGKCSNSGLCPMCPFQYKSGSDTVESVNQPLPNVQWAHQPWRDSAILLLQMVSFLGAPAGRPLWGWEGKGNRRSIWRLAATHSHGGQQKVEASTFQPFLRHYIPRSVHQVHTMEESLQ